MTHLIEAIFKCDLNKLKIFLPDKQRANQEIPGTEGCTPLHLAVGVDNKDGKEQVLSYLLEIGADPNARSFEDLTPVHIAAMWNNCKELEKLLQSGGNPWLTDNDNKNTFDLAFNNHAYEAYQLLNIYLAEDKLNFINDSSKTHRKHSSLLGDSVSLLKNENSKFHFVTANENFPYYFSSSEDETGSILSNVSKILKRSVLRNDSPEKKAGNCKKSCDYRSGNLNENGISNYSMDSNKTTQRNPAKNFRRKVPSSFCQASEISDVSFVDFSGTENDSSEIVDTDNASGIVLIQRTLPFDSAAIKNHDCTNSSDWKDFRTSTTVGSSDLSICTSHSIFYIDIPQSYKNFSNSQIFQELKIMGDNPGPILDSTRSIYLTRLARLKSGCQVSCMLPQPKYCEDIYLFLENKFDDDAIQNLMNYMAEDFGDNDPQRKWREGNQRCCFNYFLLDPRVTQNLPKRADNLTLDKLFLTFLDALFYVGKGTKGRPYNHLVEAVKAITDKQLKNDKISHILDIWDAGKGVISLHCFNNSIPVEAYTQEACIIEAVGLENLTNIKRGDYYGIPVKWRKSLKRQMGIALLHKALQIFLIEGEKQIMPKDVRRNK